MRGCGCTWVMYCRGLSVAVVVPRCSTSVGRLSMLRQPDRTNQLFCSGEYCRPLIACAIHHAKVRTDFGQPPETYREDCPQAASQGGGRMLSRHKARSSLDDTKTSL